MKKAVDAYRRAARKLFKVSQQEVETYIIDPEEDTGGWAPNALAVIRLEADCREKGDEGILPAFLGYYENGGMENCFRLGKEAGIGFVEYINPAVAAVWE